LGRSPATVVLLTTVDFCRCPPFVLTKASLKRFKDNRI